MRSLVASGGLLFISSSVIHKARLGRAISFLCSGNTGSMRVHSTYPPVVCNYGCLGFSHTASSVRLVTHQVVFRLRNRRNVGRVSRCSSSGARHNGGLHHTVTSGFGFTSLRFRALSNVIRTVNLPHRCLYACY